MVLYGSCKSPKMCFIIIVYIKTAYIIINFDQNISQYITYKCLKTCVQFKTKHKNDISCY